MRFIRSTIFFFTFILISFSEVIELTTDKAFYNALTTDKKIIVIDCYATWCGPCYYLSPILDTLSDKMKDQANFFKLDVDKHSTIAQQLNVQSIPMVFFFKNGQIVHTELGLKPEQFYRDIITKLSTITTSSPITTKHSNPKEFAQLIKKTPGLLLDVRTKEEYQKGHIKGAKLIPVQELSQKIDTFTIAKDFPIYVYCRSGNRSTTASNLLIQHGYTKVYNLSGGINAWKKTGHTIKK